MAFAANATEGCNSAVEEGVNSDSAQKDAAGVEGKVLRMAHKLREVHFLRKVYRISIYRGYGLLMLSNGLTPCL